MSDSAVWGVCVTFNPDPAVFEQALSAARDQLEGVVVVDNASSGATRQRITELCARRRARLIAFDANLGVARALNEGAARALSAGATDVLLLDDDSIAQNGMVAALLAAKRELAARGCRLAALGAGIVDADSGRVAPFVRIGWTGLKRSACSSGELVQADLLTSSGTLIPADAWRAVGPMDETLFIDHVDTDWCLRALAAGLALYGVCGARLSHRLGEGVVELTPPLGRARHVHLHSPERLYFFVRNSLSLYFRRWAPVRWCFPDALRLLRLVSFYCILHRDRAGYFRSALRGLRDGWRTRSPEGGA